ncbi:MAG: oxygen-independent coproporphyrinogen III oxidase [Gammaproteobacteria bacterium]
MTNEVTFDSELISRYDQSGPRYTSYPPANQFTDKIDASDYYRWAKRSNGDPIPKPLSLYFHIPFCNTICYYCACNKVVTKDYGRAVPYLQDLFHEIELQSTLFDSDRVVEQLHWGGGTPTFLNDEQTQMLMNKIGQYFKLRHDDGGEYSIEIDPRTTDACTISHLRSLGFNRLSLGVQDFDEQVQRAVNRVQSIEQTSAVIDQARDSRYRSINIDLIYGLPLQTVSRFSKTLETLIDLNPDRIALYNYAHLPHRFPPQRRIKQEDLPPPKEKLAIFQLAIKRLTKAGYIYIGMDHFAKPLDELASAQRRGTLHRNFQGYSAHCACDSVAMGVSAISNIGDHFSQNTNDLNNYHETLQQNRLPIQRGCETSAEDILRREIIQQLICHFRLDIHAIEKLWEIDFERHFASELQRLKPMEKDGLLELSRDRILILASGRLLIRNICMVFDHYIGSKENTVVFSRVI